MTKKRKGFYIGFDSMVTACCVGSSYPWNKPIISSYTYWDDQTRKYSFGPLLKKINNQCFAVFFDCRSLNEMNMIGMEDKLKLG